MMNSSMRTLRGPQIVEKSPFWAFENEEVGGKTALSVTLTSKNENRPSVCLFGKVEGDFLYVLYGCGHEGLLFNVSPSS